MQVVSFPRKSMVSFKYKSIAAEISAAGQSIYAYDKNSKVAKAYADFTKEVIADGERTKAKSAVSR